MYALLKLEEAKYVSVKFGWEDGHIYGYTINDITWSGHEFLDNIETITLGKVKKSQTKPLVCP